MAASSAPKPVYGLTVKVEEEDTAMEGEEEKQSQCEPNKTKKTTKTVNYWEWELASETRPLWVSHDRKLLTYVLFHLQIISTEKSTQHLQCAHTTPVKT